MTHALSSFTVARDEGFSAGVIHAWLALTEKGWTREDRRPCHSALACHLQETKRGKGMGKRGLCTWCNCWKGVQDGCHSKSVPWERAAYQKTGKHAGRLDVVKLKAILYDQVGPGILASELFVKCADRRTIEKREFFLKTLTNLLFRTTMKEATTGKVHDMSSVLWYTI